MKVVIELAVDREPDQIVSQFVQPLHNRLQERDLGQLVAHSSDELWVYVELSLLESEGMDCVLEFLAEFDAPIGSVIYRLNEKGKKEDIFVLGPPPID